MNKDGKKLLIFSIILTIIGIIVIFSASSIWSLYKFNDSFHFAKLQLIYAFVSFIACFILSKINYKLYYRKSNLILLICIVLLILVLIPGIGTVKNGSRSWFSFGFIALQPSEIAKLGLIIFLSKYLSKNEYSIKKSIKNVFPVLFVIGVVFMLIVLEPDLGSAMVMVLSLAVLIFVSGISLNFFSIGGILGLLGLTGLIIIEPYRLKRIVSFINPWSDPLGSGYQIIQSLYAIGPAGILGLGFGNSIQKQFYLPEPQNDFIFSIIAEEFGIVGVIIIILLYVLLFIKICQISFKQNDLFAKYLSFGLGTQIITQALLNMCVVVGLIPVTGVTLPFLSYGGSSLLITLSSIGIILNISKNKKK